MGFLFQISAFFIFFITLPSFACRPEDMVPHKYIIFLDKAEPLTAQKAQHDLNSQLADLNIPYQYVFDRNNHLKTAFSAAQAQALPPTMIVVEIDSEDTLNQIKMNPNVSDVQNDCKTHLLAFTPNDPHYAEQWAPPEIHLPEAWALTLGTYEVNIGVSDTGVDYTHEDLKDKMWVNAKEKNGVPHVDDDGNGYVDDIYGYDFASSDSDPAPGTSGVGGHGTHVAGIIGASINNSLGVAGVADKARLMALKGLDGPFGSTSAGAQSIIYGVDNGARVINCSWGYFTDEQVLREAISYAQSKGVLMIVAAGNETTTDLRYPGQLPGVVAIGSFQSGGEFSYFSDYGPRIDLIAPGSDIYSTYPHNSYTGMSGTSMATPEVTGLAAYVLSIIPSLTDQELKNVLFDSADRVTLHEPAGGLTREYKRINALKAVQMAIQIANDRMPQPSPPLCQPGEQGCQSFGSSVPLKQIKTHFNGMACGSVDVDRNQSNTLEQSLMLLIVLLTPLGVSLTLQRWMRTKEL